MSKKRKFDDEQCAKIRRDYEWGVAYRDLCDKWCASSSIIHRVLSGTGSYSEYDSIIDRNEKHDKKTVKHQPATTVDTIFQLNCQGTVIDYRMDDLPCVKFRNLLELVRLNERRWLDQYRRIFGILVYPIDVDIDHDNPLAGVIDEIDISLMLKGFTDLEFDSTTDLNKVVIDFTKRFDLNLKGD